MRKLVWLAGLLALNTACGSAISEAEFGGSWRIAEHRVEVVGGETSSAFQAGFFDCNASYKSTGVDFTGATVSTFTEGCLYFLSQAYDPAAGAFYEVIDPPPQVVTLLVDTDDIEEQQAVLQYGGGEILFNFEKLAGKRVLEMRSPGVVWGEFTLDVVFIVTKD